ncbi:MAG: helix-turn-helix domain-containing protein [Dehalococcoidia bacterium]|nr:helix-turn-helix domain-containing protein [Dehalococcoidia bacterium]
MLELAGQVGFTTADGIAIDLDLTQTEVANAVGASREMVNRSLRYYRLRGYIDWAGRRFVIRSPEGLRRHC